VSILNEGERGPPVLTGMYAHTHTQLAWRESCG